MTEEITAFWVHGHNNSAENDAAIKHWVLNQRYKMTLVNRLWRKLKQIHHEKGWWRITEANRERYAETRFYSPQPKTIEEFRHRIRNYVRPAEPEIDMVRIRAEQDTAREVERREERRQAAQQNQERRDAEQARLLAQREREAADPNLIIQRNIQLQIDEGQRQFEANQRQAIYQNDLLVRVQNQALRAFKPTKPPSISVQMDPLETAYFINENCPICLEPQTQGNTIALGCRHTCCVSCLKQAMKPGGKHFCVICRNTITQIRFKPDITPDNFNIISKHNHSLA
ncbi:MAG: RING finger protein [Dehalococcoidia bacterium]|nr:RING finger protein [Dehalococcoidia bacterium]